MGNPFLGLDAATLATMKTAYVNAVLALAQNQAYSLNGRSLTRSNLTEVKNTLGQIIAAEQAALGQTTDTTLVSFTGL
jgi:hypothetical protein